MRRFFVLLQWVLVRRGGLLPNAAASLAPPHRAILPIAGALLASLVLWIAKRWARPRTYQGYVEAVRFHQGRIPFASTAWRTVSSAFSIATGAAIGREGSMIQFATAVASWTGARQKTAGIPLVRKVACGVAAAVAAAYQAPIAGVFFACEIVLGKWTVSLLPELGIAAALGWLMSRWLLGPGPIFAVHGTLTWASFGWTLPLALLMTLLGPLYQRLLRSFSFLRKAPLPLLWGGVAVGLLSLANPVVWGNGDVGLMDTIAGRETLAAIAIMLLLRVVATAVCMGAGTVGGVFTPTLFAGAALGLLCAHLLHAAQPVLLAVTGLSVLLAAVTHAPWMATFMAVEVTGQWRLLPLLAVLNFSASFAAHRISPRALYDIATPQAARE